MSKEKQKPLLHEPAMAKVAKGKYAVCVDLLRVIAAEARSTNAGTAAVKFSFISDDEAVHAQFVPEITVSVRTLED